MTASANSALLHVDGLTKVFPPHRRNSWARAEAFHPGGVIAISDLTLQVVKGELVAVVGPSGCGKTTLLRIVAGLETPTSGRVILGGSDVVGPGRDRAMVFQAYSSFPWLTVQDNVEFALRHRPDIRPSQRHQVADEFLDLVGLSAFAKANIRQLSGGMQQRVAIARTLAADPQLLLMDEPFGALDPQTREGLQLQLLNMQKARRQTIMFVTHDVEEAAFLADRVIVLTARPGRIRKEFRIPFSGTRSLDLKYDPKFVALRAAVLAVVRAEAAQEPGGERKTITDELGSRFGQRGPKR